MSMAHGSCPIAHRPWPMSHGPWPMSHGPSPMAHGPSSIRRYYARAARRGRGGGTNSPAAVTVRVRPPRYHRSMRERTIEVNGQPTRVIEAGGGWPVVLLHAFPMHAGMWRPQLEHIPQGWRFVAPDLRGFGPSRPAVSGPLSMTDYASDIETLLDALQLDRAWVGG